MTNAAAAAAAGGRGAERAAARQKQILFIKRTLTNHVHTPCCPRNPMADALQLGFDLKGEGMFSDGHTFAPMTYTALCEYVADESRRLGGPPLRPQKRLNSNGSIDYVVFYCPHGRKHGDQAGRKPIKNPNRALRTKGDRKTLFCDCKFRFRVRLDRAVPPILVANEKDAQDAAHPGAARCSNSKKDQSDHERYVYGWYVDSRLATKPNLIAKHHAAQVRRLARAPIAGAEIQEVLS